MIEKAKCTLCAAEESPGFYTGCMIKDGHLIHRKETDWQCDGNGNLTREIGHGCMCSPAGTDDRVCPDANGKPLCA